MKETPDYQDVLENGDYGSFDMTPYDNVQWGNLTPASERTNAYITMITRDNDLPNVIMLAYGLKEHNSNFPLIVMFCNDTMSPEVVEMMRSEAVLSNMILHDVKLLLPLDEDKEDFAADSDPNSWTNLRVFQTHHLFFRGKFCYVDADMVVLMNPDGMFKDCEDLLAQMVDDFIKSPRAPYNVPWMMLNQAAEKIIFAPQGEGTDMWFAPQIDTDGPDTRRLFGSGIFVFTPKVRSHWSTIITFFLELAPLQGYPFPNQDFLY
jgi:alpha-N-acetylglucosamine transferase